MTNDLTNYLGAAQLPSNPFKQESGNYHLGKRSEGMQVQADMEMAQYNQQAAQAQLLKQRQWALEDRDYNNPENMRARLEAAGYNPALMSGMVQTANQPVRGSAANVPSGNISNVAGIGAQKFSNVIEAGKSLVSSLLARKQAQVMDAEKNLMSSQAIRELANANLSKSQKNEIDSLVPYQIDAIKGDIALKDIEYEKIASEIDTLMPSQVAKNMQDVKLSQAELEAIGISLGYQGRMTSANEAKIYKEIEAIATSIAKDTEFINQIKIDVANGEVELARQKIQARLERHTEGSRAVGSLMDPVGKALGLGFLGIGAAKVGSVTKVKGFR